MPAICWLAVVVWAQTAEVRPPAAMPHPSPTATIRGTIVDARTSAPIADARVTLAPLQAAGDDNGANAIASDRLRWLNTGPDGRFEFGDVPPGAYTLTVSTIGYIFVRRTVDVSTTAPVEIVVPLAEGTGTNKATTSPRYVIWICSLFSRTRRSTCVVFCLSSRTPTVFMSPPACLHS